jgi:hypothetical protein
MAADTYRCPRCPALLGRTAASPPGSSVRCPGCRHVFPVPPLDAIADELPPLLLPEPPGPTRPRRPLRGPRPVQLTNEFTPNFNLWFRMAGGCWADFLWPYIGFTGACGGILGFMYFFGLFTAAITFGLSLLGIVPVAIALAQLTAALPLGPAIKAVLGRDYELMDFIYGLERIIPILLYTAMNAVFLFLAYGWLIAVLVVMAINSGNANAFFSRWSVAMVMGVVGYAVFLVPLAYMVMFTRFSFALCLVFDRKMGFFEAMATSWKMTKGHFGTMFLLLLLQTGLLFAGLLPCGVATGFTVSYAFLLRAAAYVHATTPRDVVAYAAPGAEPDEDDYPSLEL